MNLVEIENVVLIGGRYRVEVENISFGGCRKIDWGYFFVCRVFGVNWVIDFYDWELGYGEG